MHSIEILMSVMNETGFDLIDESRICSDVVMINQCQDNGYIERTFHDKKQRVINVYDKGLSKSRNMALLYASGDICILCDNDIVYVDNYEEIIQSAYKEIPDADVIIFEVINVKDSEQKQTHHTDKIRKAPWYKNYGTYEITFNRSSVYKKQIWFNTLFGAGSMMYEHGEDSLFIRSCHKAKLKVYLYPKVLCYVTNKESTWNNGEKDKKYFFDAGALVAAGYPKLKHFLKLYLLLRIRDTKLSKREISREINNGIKGYKSNKNYQEYYSK